MIRSAPSRVISVDDNIVESESTEVHRDFLQNKQPNQSRESRFGRCDEPSESSTRPRPWPKLQSEQCPARASPTIQEGRRQRFSAFRRQHDLRDDKRTAYLLLHSLSELVENDVGVGSSSAGSSGHRSGLTVALLRLLLTVSLALRLLLTVLLLSSLRLAVTWRNGRQSLTMNASRKCSPGAG